MITLRIATPHDAPAIREIYAPYVLNTAITYEYEVPSIEEFEKRITTTLEKYPYLVAEEDGLILGYAYLSTFIGRSASDWCAETSIYVSLSAKGRGIGKALYRGLEVLAKQQHLLNLNAAIAYTEAEDVHLTNDSVSFHTHIGYQIIGHFHRCGYKFQRWYDLVWMEKWIGDHSIPPAPFLPFPKILKKSEKVLDNLSII